MLTAKQKHPAARNSEGGSDIDLGCISSPHVGKLSDNYEYSGDDKALSIRETLNCSILSMLVLLFFLSIAAYAAILGLRYIVATTNHYGEEENCMQSQMAFNGWSFKYYCMSCVEGFTRGHGGTCVQHEH